MTTAFELSLSRDIATLVRPRIEKGQAVGIVVGVVRDGHSSVHGFGRPSLDEDGPPDNRTVFEIGSITKVFTSISLADMAEAGLVKLDEPLQDLLPDGVRVPSRNGRAITLRTLANHRSGLPKIIPKVLGRAMLGKDPYDGVGASDLFAFLKSHELKRDPGESFEYSNLGAALLGTALARRAGTTYEELTRSRICRPLGMRDTRIVLDSEQRSRLAKPYTSRRTPAIPWTFDAFAGAGALRSTADDMLAFARANLGLNVAPGTLRKALEDARTPRTAADREGVSVGLGWLVFAANERPGRPEIVWHNGGTGGFRSFLGLAHKAKAAVVVMSNSDASVDALGLSALDRVLAG